MAAKEPTIRQEIKRYVRTGDYDNRYGAWSGGFLERDHRCHDDLRTGLVAEVQRLTAGRNVQSAVPKDTVVFTRRKVEPMIRGLFPRAEQEMVLAVVEKSVIFLTPDNIALVLMESQWHNTAWDLANLYLASVGSKLLGKDAPHIVGLSAETTCYVSPAYFDDDDPFSDFVVHEAAHIFHNCKRRTIGLPETRRKEWLLPIEYRMRETFAYSCEAYARILERSATPTQRRLLAADFASKTRITDERVDSGVVGDIVQSAAAARNGWKVILACCDSPHKMRSARTRSLTAH